MNEPVTLIPEQKLANAALMEELGREANPYPANSPEWKAWNLSWIVGRMRQVIEEGRRARAEGKSITDCPADLEEPFPKAWRLGWEGKVRKK